jgi:uncharacterized protein
MHSEAMPEELTMPTFRLSTNALCILWVLSLAHVVLAQPPSPSPQRSTITVQGEALVYVQPDKVLITCGVETIDVDVKLSKKKNNDLIASAFAILKEQAIPPTDVQTDYLTLEPKYVDQYPKSEPKFLGYVSRNTFVVTIRDITKLEPVLSSLLVAGINRIQGIEFQTSELKVHRERAREMALLAAKEKAQKMAATLESKIGRPLQITENASAAGWPGYGRANAMSQNAAVDLPSNEPVESETVALGKLPVKASVSITFQLLAIEAKP